MKKITGIYSTPESHTPPPNYDRLPVFNNMKRQSDVMVQMRDGVHLCIDIYYPDAEGKFPALLAYAPHNKDLQGPEATEAFGPQPAWSPLWFGGQEAGDTRFFVSRGYAHIIANPRGIGKSEDTPNKVGPDNNTTDLYDLIEWIAQQPWCDGNVGMTGISAFAYSQWQAALQQPPHLKAIFPYDAFFAFPFRDFTPGGVSHIMLYLLDQSGVGHMVRSRPGQLPEPMEKLWQEAMNNPDYRMYPQVYNLLTQKGQHSPEIFFELLNPYDTEEGLKKAEEKFKKITIPAYTGAGWYAYSYKLHHQGCQNWYMNIDVPKKLLFTGAAHLERPFHSFHSEILRWYDYWLKGIDTGIMQEPPVKLWLMGANEWYSADDWPLPETKWTKYYLHSWERLREEPFTPSSRDSYEEPDVFVQMPPKLTRHIQRLRYMTEPLPEDTVIAGPCSLKIFAAIDRTDTNWIIILKDVGPDPSQRTAREGETYLPANLPERELTRGWLKASHRVLDPERTKPHKPWHKFTREARQPVIPGEITEYDIEILSTANMFRKGHRICVDITCADMPTGAAGFTNVEYIPYHICSSKTTVHKIYHNEKYPSHLLLPVIPPEKIT